MECEKVGRRYGDRRSLQLLVNAYPVTLRARGHQFRRVERLKGVGDGRGITSHIGDAVAEISGFGIFYTTPGRR